VASLPRRTITVALLIAGLMMPATVRAGPPSGVARAVASVAAPGCADPIRVQVVPGLQSVDGLTVAAQNDLWVRGRAATAGGVPILHWDGHSWRSAVEGLPPGSGLTSIAAAGPGAVWGIGSMQAGNPRAGVLVVHQHGGEWRPVTPRTLPTQLYGKPVSLTMAQDFSNLAVVADDDVWLATGTGYGTPAVIHWDGRRWSPVPGAGAFGVISTRRIAASGPADVWLVGAHEEGGPAALHYNGHGWSEPSLGITNLEVFRSDGSAQGLESALLDVAALSPGEVWGVGTTMHTGAADYVDQRGLAMHWDGTRWYSVPVPYPGTSTDLHAVAVAAPSDVWALGGQGLGLLHWNGARWTRVPAAGAAPSIIAVVSPDRVLVGGTRPGTAGGHDQAALAEYGMARCALADPVERRSILPSGSTTAALDVVNQHLFAIGDSATMIDVASGRVLASTPMDGKAMAAVVASRVRRVFVLSSVCPQDPYRCATSLTRLDAGSGAALGTASLADPPVALALGPGERRVYVLTAPNADAGGAGTLSAFNTSSGTLAYTHTVGLNPRALAVDGRTGRLFVVDGGPGQWAGSYGPFFSPSASADLLTIDPVTGGTLRTTPLPARAWITSAVAAATGGVYVWLGPYQPEGAWIAVVAADGTPVSARQVPSLDRAGLAPQVRAMLQGGLAYDSRDRRFIGTFQAHDDHYGHPNGGGLVSLTDALGGAEVASAPVGSEPAGVFWDDPLRRALVVTASYDTGDHARAIDQPETYRPVAPHGTLVTIDPDPSHTVPLVPVTPADPVPSSASRGGRYFAPTRHRLVEPFLAYWLAHGDVATLGYPLTEPFVEDGHPAQYTERFLLEEVDGAVRPVPLGRLLSRAGGHSPPAPAPGGGGSRMYFPATGQSLTGRFLRFWGAHGGEALLGPPIAAPTLERNGDRAGRTYLVQWCANARLEYHPEAVGTAYEVELGLLGRQDVRRRGWLRR